VKAILTFLTGLLPACAVKNRLLTLFGHDVHPTASLAPILIIGKITHLSVGAGVTVGPLTAFRNVPRVELCERCELGQLNWISAAPFLLAGSPVPDAGLFRLGPDSSVTNRHYFDVSGGVIIGPYTTVAGVHSVFMTHGIDVGDAVLDTAPIRVGHHCMVGGCCHFVLGSEVPDYSVVAMGSVVVRGLQEPQSIFGGTPARRLRELAPGKYHTRTKGPIGPRWDPYE